MCYASDNVDGDIGGGDIGDGVDDGDIDDGDIGDGVDDGDIDDGGREEVWPSVE